MTSSDSAWLSFWSGLAVIGCIVVVIGVVLEGAEYFVKWGKKKRFRKWVGAVFNDDRRRLVVSWVKYIKPRILPIETVGFTMLVFGLAVELLGGFAAGRMQSKENSELETTNTQLSLQIEELHSNNLALQAKLQPRIITDRQITNFIFLTEYLPKFPVRVEVAMPSEETASFAWQVRRMLNKATFPTPNSDTNLPIGVDFLQNAYSVPFIQGGTTNIWADAEFVTDRTNDFKYFHFLASQHTNGFDRYFVADNDTNDLYSAFISYLIQDGIEIEVSYTPGFVEKGQCAILIKQKP